MTIKEKRLKKYDKITIRKLIKNVNYKNGFENEQFSMDIWGDY